MNQRDKRLPIPDVQATPDTRQLAIDRVGIKAIRHPVKVRERTGGIQHTIALFNMYVGLPHQFKGTHMSRFVEILNAHEREISPDTFRLMLREMVAKLEAVSGHVEMTFPYFVNKKAPVSGVESLMDYEVTFVGEILDGRETFTLKVLVPVQSLCPCSKKISDRGAHNQRSHVTVAARINKFVWIEEIIDQVEGEASSELWGLLKRPDEKYVTGAGLRQSQVRRGHGARHRRRPERRPAHRRLRGGERELRVHPQPLGVRDDHRGSGLQFKRVMPA
jgi:GTP cyclohydrolase I